MRSTSASLFVLSALVAGCLGDADPVVGNEASEVVLDQEGVARIIFAQTGWAYERPQPVIAADTGEAQSLSAPTVFALTRTVVADDIVHYAFKVRVGAGPFDVIGMHRVVRETTPYVPDRSHQSVFFDHGDYNSFVTGFMAGIASANVPDDYGLPVYLAKHGIDVWGIDHGWTLVPPETTDFSFMKDWGIMKDVAHLRIAIGISRTVRQLAGSGHDKVTLLGWSTGSVRTFAYANEESQLPAPSRQVKAIIPVDQYLKTDDPELIGLNCAEIESYAADIAQGIYEDDTGLLVQAIGALAAFDPNGGSPIYPGFTNSQFAVIFGAATYWFALPMAPCFHFAGGMFDEYGLPNGLQYTPSGAWFEYLMAFSAWMPNQILVDEYAVACPQFDVPFDDHLDDVTVPVLWVAAGGGYGETMANMMSLLGSTDVTGFTASDNEDRCLDYGHVDLFWGSNAQTLVWDPILSWIQQH